MPKILAIETSTAACSVALDVDGKVSQKFEIIPRGHASVLLLWINELLTQAKATLKDLDAIAFGCGPGGFTGVRIGVGVIQGLALGANLALISISSLRALAQSAFNDHGIKQALIIQDAKMGEVYWGVYASDSHGLMQPVTPDQLSQMSAITSPEKGDWVRVGDMTDFQPCYPTASNVLKLAQKKYEAGEILDVSEALPVYLRGKDAWKKSQP